jgi:HEAT repeat protein
MSKVSRYRFLQLFCLLLVSLILPALTPKPGFAIKCSSAKIEWYMKQLAAQKQTQLNALAQCGSLAVPPLVAMLKDPKQEVRRGAIRTLNLIGLEAKPAVQPLIQVLLDLNNRVEVRASAAYALGNIRPQNKNTISVLLNVLKQDTNDDVRAAVAYALGQNKATDREVVLELTKVLGSTGEDTTIRRFAARALGEIAEENRTSVQALAVPTLLKVIQNQDQDTIILAESAYALGAIGETSGTVISTLVGTLKNQNSEIRIRSALALASIGEVLYNQSNTNQEIERARPTLTKIEAALSGSKLGTEPEVTQAQRSVTGTLQNLSHKQKALLNEQIIGWVTSGKTIWLTHATFWLFLIFAYPKSRQIQAIFFWNSWIRNIFGLGYVTFLLQWVPFLRRKLFEPFKPSLLADAGLDFFKPDLYFPDSEVSRKETESSQAITAVCPSIQGQRIIEGDSGLGKTMFLRHLLQQSQRIVVYLPATKCAEGVIEAIQKKLHGDEIKDTKFLQSLIYSGAINICIDGLNEVNPDTRAKITQFVESHFKGNILMTTQPLEWTPPSTAKTYVLQPLKPDQIERYLRSRQPLLPKTAPVQGTTYEQACRTFLENMLGAQTPLSPEELKTARTILSNPMELTLAAWMLAGGVQPDLFNLRQQQYEQMAEEYRRTWNQDFPLKQFSETVYQQWLLDQKALPADKFYNELLCMEDEKFRMVVSRQWRDAKGNAKKEWYFRHDKIAEFFLVQTFLGKGTDAETRLLDHIGDSRFRGVYFLLATLMDLEAAKELREKLIQYAADTKDHTVSDTFVQLLRSRA